MDTPSGGNTPSCTGNGVAHGSSCTFTCQDGYHKSHELASVCGDGTGTTGEWSPDPPTCHRKLYE